MLLIADEDIGGARVRRTFTNGGRQMRAGDTLTAPEVLAIPQANRRALIDTQHIEVWPKPEGYERAERFIVSRGKGEFDVVAGVRINDEPLSIDHAKALRAARDNS